MLNHIISQRSIRNTILVFVLILQWPIVIIYQIHKGYFNWMPFVPMFSVSIKYLFHIFMDTRSTKKQDSDLPPKI